jgi:hypothetical protein
MIEWQSDAFVWIEIVVNACKTKVCVHSTFNLVGWQRRITHQNCDLYEKLNLIVNELQNFVQMLL